MNLDGTAHGDCICKNCSVSAGEIETLIIGMQHACPSFDHDNIKDTSTSSITIVQIEDLSQVDQISFIRKTVDVNANKDDDISSICQGNSVKKTKVNLCMTVVLGPYISNKVSFSSQVQPQVSPIPQGKFYHAAFDFLHNHSFNHNFLLFWLENFTMLLLMSFHIIS